ncbi:leucine-rich PPR motif-containing protein, mitochondrial [Pelodytes ibericus]
MSALLAGARLVLRAGLYSLPAPRVRLSSAPARYLVNSPRFCAVATQEQGSTKHELPPAVRQKQVWEFDRALSKLDSSVRRTGRIRKSLLLSIFHDVCRTGVPSGDQVLLLLRSCGTLMPELPMTERIEIAHRIWDKLKEIGAVYDVSHYNALLKVYLQNEHKFSPTEFLANMEAANVQPSPVTYQRLIAAYCHDGDIEGASKILGFMKNKDLPITEEVFNTLVTGHARAGDMENAKNILTVMQGAGIEPGPDTHIALLSAYAEKGDIESIKQTLGNVDKYKGHLTDRDLMQIMGSLAKAGYPQYIRDVVEHMRFDRAYKPDAMNLCLSLMTQGYEDAAFQLLMNFSSTNSVNGDYLQHGNFFLRHCATLDLPASKVTQFCDGFQEVNLHATPLEFVLYCALESQKPGLAIDLMKIMKEKGMPVRPHYCWPLLAHYQKDKNIQGTIEVIKAFNEMGVQLDIDTYTNYILNIFEGVQSARTLLKDNGCTADGLFVLVSELRHEAGQGNLSQVYTLLSSPDSLPVPLRYFRGSLISAFKKSDDAGVMAKITELLYKDDRYSQAPSGPTAEDVGYFLFNLIDSMTESEVQANKPCLRQYFHQLNEMNITISANIYRGIRNALDARHSPDLIKDIIVLVNPEALLSHTDTDKTEFSVAALEKKMESLKAENKPIGEILARLIAKLCFEEDLKKALEVKAKYEEHLTVGAYASLLNLCCRQDNTEEALNLKQELDTKDPSAVLNFNKCIALVKLFARNGYLTDAINILKEMKEKDVQGTETANFAFFHIINACSIAEDVKAVNQLHECIVSLRLAQPTANLCSPLVSVHLRKGDLPGAINAMIECSKKYRHMPLLHDICTKLVEKEDTEQLQKVMDHTAQIRGDMEMLYSLLFAFLENEKYAEARKIVETPGLRARPRRLEWFAEKCIASNKVEILESLVELTQDLFECDKDEMNFYLLKLYKQNNDWQKAQSVWNKIQKENVVARQRTLQLLAEIFRNNGQDVPPEISQTILEKHTEPQASSSAIDPEYSYDRKILVLSKKQRGKEAYDVFVKAENDNTVLSAAAYMNLIKTLLADGDIEAAGKVKTAAENHIKGFTLNSIARTLYILTQVRRDYLKDALAALKSAVDVDMIPGHLAVTRLVQALAMKGDLESIEEVEKITAHIVSSISLSNMLFINNKTLAQLRNGKLEAVEELEALYTAGEPSKVGSISYLFRKVIEEKMEPALDQLSAMAERLANQFAVYRPAADLFVQYINNGRKDDARFLLQRCGAIAEQMPVFISFIVSISQSSGKAPVITDLLELIPDFPKKDLAYFYLMKCYANDNNVAAASALYEEMKEKNVNVSELTLKRLAVLLKGAGQTVPFTEPPESFTFYAKKLKQERMNLPDSPHDEY